MPGFRYTPESTTIAATADLQLRFAAAHIEHVGLTQGHTFAGAGRTTSLSCSVLGAVLIGAGEGRVTSGRTYPWHDIRRARDHALSLLARQVALHRPAAPPGWGPEQWDRVLICEWSDTPGRTTAEAARALGAAADTARRPPAPAHRIPTTATVTAPVLF
ncbi:DUF6197 family protein [Streptomyces goshikiensis]|uniref:DUF6197 family protein n=1 Tax=Streptomyces goshikiensis TaxID=1942 RepID=UPI0033E9BDE7